MEEDASCGTTVVRMRERNARVYKTVPIHLPEGMRADQPAMRHILLGHMCSGAFSFAELQDKGCANAVAGQTHAVYEHGELTYAGTGHFKRTDIAFEGGFIHEVTSVLMVLSVVRDSHSEQVWKKSLQPSPIVSVLGGGKSTGTPALAPGSIYATCTCTCTCAYTRALHVHMVSICGMLGGHS